MLLPDDSERLALDLSDPERVSLIARALSVPKRLEILLENVSGSTVVLDYGEGMEKATVPEEISITEIKIVDCPLSARVAMEELLGSYRVEFISAEEAAGLSMALPYEMRDEE